LTAVLTLCLGTHGRTLGRSFAGWATAPGTASTASTPLRWIGELSMEGPFTAGSGLRQGRPAVAGPVSLANLIALPRARRTRVCKNCCPRGSRAGTCAAPCPPPLRERDLHSSLPRREVHRVALARSFLAELAAAAGAAVASGGRGRRPRRRARGQ